MRKIAEAGTIGKDGKLRMPMDRLNGFFRANPGKRVIMTIEAVEPGSTALQQSYYYRYVLPAAVEAMRDLGTRMTEAQADRWLLSEYPGDADGETGRELSQGQMSDYLDWLRQYAAENLSIYIEDPR